MEHGMKQKHHRIKCNQICINRLTKGVQPCLLCFRNIIGQLNKIFLNYFQENIWTVMKLHYVQYCLVKKIGQLVNTV